MGQHTVFWFLSHRRAAKTPTRLGICAVSSEPLLLTYTKYESKARIMVKYRPLALLYMLGCVFKGGFCVCAISTKNIRAGPN